MATPAVSMNKDALLATLIGLGMGLFITGIIVAGPKLLGSFPKLSIPTISLPKKTGPAGVPTPTPEKIAFRIESPVADSVVAKGELLVSGTAAAGAVVVVAGPTDEDVIVADANGKYAGTVTLSEGKNDVAVTGYVRDTKDSQTVTVFYIQ